MSPRYRLIEAIKGFLKTPQGAAAFVRALEKRIKSKKPSSCPWCLGRGKKFGFFLNKNRRVQRYICKQGCGTFSRPQPFDGSRIKKWKAREVLSMKARGFSQRKIAKFIGINCATVRRILMANKKRTVRA